MKEERGGEGWTRTKRGGDEMMDGWMVGPSPTRCWLRPDADDDDDADANERNMRRHPPLPPPSSPLVPPPLRPSPGIDCRRARRVLRKE